MKNELGRNVNSWAPPRTAESQTLKVNLTVCFKRPSWILKFEDHWFRETSGSVGKESACNAGDLGSIPGSGRSPGEGNGNPLQYSYLENSMDRGAGQATVHGVAKCRTQLYD